MSFLHVGIWKQKLEIKASALAGYMEGGTICALYNITPHLTRFPRSAPDY